MAATFHSGDRELLGQTIASHKYELESVNKSSDTYFSVVRAEYH